MNALPKIIGPKPTNIKGLLQTYEHSYDLIILGGGCAGLSLAMRLAAQGKDCPRTLLLEARPSYSDDRTWCFWDDGSFWLHHLVRHSWKYMTVTTVDQSTTADCGAVQYRMISAGAFYVEALNQIALNEHIDVMLASPVLDTPQKMDGAWRVATTAGMVTAGCVIDTRPTKRPHRNGAALWQSFSGHEVVCNLDMFDPTRTDLMDFSETGKGRISFTYVLPTSAKSALIEATIFDPEPFDLQAMASNLSHATKRLLGNTPYAVIRSEHGILPMGGHRHAPHTDPTYITAGLNEGGARPSSGYAFRRIQTWAEQCAATLLKGGLPHGHAQDPILLKAMDHLFLSVLAERPDVAPALFYALFAKANTQRLIRFLSDRGTIADYIAMAAALPTGLFIKQIPAALMQRSRQTQVVAPS